MLCLTRKPKKLPQKLYFWYIDKHQ